MKILGVPNGEAVQIEQRLFSVSDKIGCVVISQFEEYTKMTAYSVQLNRPDGAPYQQAIEVQSRNSVVYPGFGNALEYLLSSVESWAQAMHEGVQDESGD